MGKKQLIINLFANIIAFGTSLAISFLLTPYLISSIGKEAYGFFPISNNFVSYFMIITIVLNSMASRFITIEIVKRNYDKAKTYYSSVLIANILLSILLIIPMTVIIIFLDKILDIPNTQIIDVKILFTMVFASMLISLISSVYGIATFAENRLDLRSGGDIFQGLLKILLYIFLFKTFKPSIYFIGLVALILSIVNLMVQIIFTRKLLPDFRISIRRFKIDVIRELLASGIWTSISSLGNALLLGASLLLANIFIGTSASGELSIVQTMPQLINSIITMLLAVFLPRITHVYAGGDRLELLKEINFSQKVLGLLSTTPVILILIFGQEFFSLWLPNENAGKLQVLSFITTIPLIIQGNMWTYYGLIIIFNKVRTPSIVLIIFGISNIIICYVLLKYFIMSIYVIPIVVTSFSLLLYIFFIPAYVTTLLSIKKITFYKNLIKTIIFSLVMMLISGYIKQYIVINSWMNLFLWGGIFGIIILASNTIIILSKNDIKNIKVLILHYLNER